jgi:hypothetical protein
MVKFGFYNFYHLFDECNTKSTVYSFGSTQHATHAYSCKNTTHMYVRNCAF